MVSNFEMLKKAESKPVKKEPKIKIILANAAKTFKLEKQEKVKVIRMSRPAKGYMVGDKVIVEDEEYDSVKRSLWEKRKEEGGMFQTLEKLDSGVFHCKLCNREEFHVSQSEKIYATIIKCVNCGWESIIHQG